MYNVIFTDCAVFQNAENLIAENIYSQVDSNGHHTLLLKKNIDHRKSAMSVPIDDKFVISKTGRKSLMKTTNGCDFFCL